MNKALKSLYDGKCTIIEYKKVQKPNKSMGFSEVLVYSDVPCRLSFSSSNPINHVGEGVSALNQTIKLFLENGYVIRPGSKIIVTQHGVTQEYKSSSVPAVYSNHQEINLNLFEGWA